MAEMNVLWTPDWYRTLFDCIKVAQQDVFLVSPWLKMAGAELILNALFENTTGMPHVRLLTTLEDADLAESSRISDLEAYLLLVSYGVAVRVVRGLHAKIYIFDDAQAIVTSGNLTARGLGRTSICNLEVALHVTSGEVVHALKAQLSPVWASSHPLTPRRLKEVATRIMNLSGDQELTIPAQKASTTRDNPLYTPQSTGKWWQGSGAASSGAQSVRISVQGSDLFASLELDSDLREAFVIAREARQRGAKRLKTRSTVTPRRTSKGTRNQAPDHPEPSLTDPLAPPLPVLTEQDISAVATEGPEPDTDQVFLDEIHQALEHEESGTAETDINVVRVTATFSSSLPDTLAGPLQCFVAVPGGRRRPTPDLVETLACELSEIEKQSTDAKRTFIEVILDSPNPALGVQWLVEAKALLALGLPEIAKMVEYSKNQLGKWRSPYHRTLRGLRHCTGRGPVRWAVLLHGLGVEETVLQKTRSRYETASVRHAASLLERFQIPEQMQACILSLIEQHNYFQMRFDQDGDRLEIDTFVQAALPRFAQDWRFHIAVAEALSSDRLRNWLSAQHAQIESAFLFAELNTANSPNVVSDDSTQKPVVVLDDAFVPDATFPEAVQWLKELSHTPYDKRRLWSGDDPEKRAFSGIISSLLSGKKVVNASEVLGLLEEVNNFTGNCPYSVLLRALEACGVDARTLADWINSRRNLLEEARREYQQTPTPASALRLIVLLRQLSFRQEATEREKEAFRRWPKNRRLGSILSRSAQTQAALVLGDQPSGVSRKKRRKRN